MLEQRRTGDTTDKYMTMLETCICGKGHVMSDECKDYSSPGVMIMCSKDSQRDEANKTTLQETLSKQKSYILMS